MICIHTVTSSSDEDSGSDSQYSVFTKPISATEEEYVSLILSSKSEELNYLTIHAVIASSSIITWSGQGVYVLATSVITLGAHAQRGFVCLSVSVC